jgi:Cellulase (glycosyl hydrolase family 5)
LADLGIIERTHRARERARSRIFAILLCAALIATALGASTASARGLTTGFTDNAIFDPSSQHPSGRGLWLDRAVDAHAGIIRISVDWRNTVRNQPKNPTNPADPAYGFDRLDTAVEQAKARGLNVVLTVYRAPDWAEGANPPPGIEPGAWKPDPVKYGQFGQALARRYSGHFRGLPQVRDFEVWTEPNLTQFLAPQWVGKKQYAPIRYRQMLNRFYAGVHAAQPDATVIAGATSPFGDSRKHQLYPDHPRMRPIVFLRSVLCLNAKLKGTKCNEKPHLDAVSAHPLNIRNAPHYKPHNKDDSQVANFGRIRTVVRAAGRAKKVEPRGRPALWVTEAGFLSDPPNPKGASLQKQARWLEQSLYLLWKQGASVVVNLNIRDPAYDPHHPPSGQWTTGIYAHSGKPKPAFRAWKFPFVTSRKSKSKVQAWGKAPASGKLQIQKQQGSKWHTVKRLTVHGGNVFKKKLRVRGKAKLRARIGQTKSITWHQGR